MKRYELKLIEGGKGIFKVSVVKDPAIESTLVYFSADSKEKHFFTDQEKKVIYSIVMRPNIDIFRKNINGEPATIFYTPETVEQAQINYFRNNGNSATNINHSSLADAEGIFPFESWIVSDAKTDRAVNFGLDVKVGDWVMGHKVDNDELWSEHIKTGKLDGLSIEATNINYIEMKTDNKKNKSVVTFIKEAFNELVGKAEKFEEEIAEVSKWWNTVTNDTFELGDVVMRKGFEDDDEPFAINAGEFELEDGRRILTDSEGIIRFIFPAPDAAPDADTDTDTEETEEMKKQKAKAVKMAADDDDEEATKKAAKAAKDAADDDDEDEDKKVTALEAEIVELKATIATLKADAVKADADLEKMKKQTPAAEKIKNLPEPLIEMSKEDYGKMNNREKMKFNRENSQY